MNRSVPLLLLGAACSCSAMELVPGGFDIVVGDKAPPAVTFAAEELKEFLTQAGMTPAEKASRHIYLGEAFAAKAGIDVGSKPRDTYFIRVKDGDLYLAGRDHPRRKPLTETDLEGFERATAFAVYAFLETFAGCRFYFPGELGTVVPKTARIEVPDSTDIVSSPAWIVRKYYNHSADGTLFEGADPLTKRKNWLRLKMATCKVPCCHGSIRFKIQERFAKTHPEYFALKTDGTRCNTFTGAPSSRHGHLCWTCPGLLDVFFEECRARFAKGEEYVDIMANDAYPGCWCKECQRRYRRDLGSNYLTDIMWDFTATLARRLSAAGIKGKITQMAYANYNALPDFDIPDNVKVMVAVGGPWSNDRPEEKRRQYDNILAWTKKTGGPVWIWCYPHKYGANVVAGVPDVAPRAWGEWYRGIADSVFGTFAESETDHWIYHYLNYYVFSRVCWDGAKADVAAILDEHHRLMFGPAAKEMQAFYELLEERWLHGMVGNIKETNGGPVVTPPTERDLWTKIYSPEIRAKMDELLKAAESKVAAGSIEAKRVAFFRREYFDGFIPGEQAFRQKLETVRRLRWDPAADGKLRLNWYTGDRINKEEVGTRVSVVRTEKDLVFTFECDEPRLGEGVPVKLREHDDGEIWKDAGVEVFINPSGDRVHYLHFVVNEKGSLSDWKCEQPGRGYGVSDIKWESGAKATVTPYADGRGWTTVLTVPLAALGEMKEEFPAEFLRNRMTTDGNGMGYYKWSMIDQNINDLEIWGTMRPLGR